MSDQRPQYSQEQQLRGLIEQLDEYIAEYHGGSVELVSYDGRVVRVRLGGACQDCALSPTTLKGWVEGTVKQFFPEVESVEDAGNPVI